ncbi:MAG TPA: HAD-IB family hydrolase [Dietzia sp.]|nr:HAD-IB family hydrolase [Dietzia sp.]
MRLPGTISEVQHSPEGAQVGAFFDLDGTLVAGYTAAALTTARRKEGEFTLADSLRSLVPLLAFARGKVGFADMVQASNQGLAGKPVGDLTELGQKVFESRISDLIYPEMRRIVLAHQQRGHTVVLCSSALQLQVEPVAAYLGVDHVLCNRFELDDERRLTGRVVEPVIWGPTKSYAVQEFAADHGIELRDSYFYADGDEDAPLMYHVGKPRPTNPGKELARIAERRGWPVVRLSSRGSGLMGPIKSAAAIWSLAATAAAGATVGLVTLDKRKGLNVMTRNYPRFLLAVNGVTLNVKGREHLDTRPAVFIFNHRTNLDTVMVSALVGRDFTGVAKKELEANPFVGPLGKVMDVAFVERGGRAQDIESLRRIEELTAKGLSIIIAPEGHRFDTDTVGPFKKGAFRMAMSAGLPIVPLIFRNAEDISGRNSTSFHAGQVDVLVGAPIETADWDLQDLDNNIAEVRQMYIDTLTDWPQE